MNRRDFLKVIGTVTAGCLLPFKTPKKPEKAKNERLIGNSMEIIVYDEEPSFFPEIGSMFHITTGYFIYDGKTWIFIEDM